MAPAPSKHQKALQPGITIFSLSSRAPKSRIGAPKSRAGCKECKRRHIRCDEGKPSCRKCIAGGRECIWALDPRRNTAPPEGNQQQQLAAALTSATQGTFILPLLEAPSLVTSTFRSQSQWDSFRYFLRSNEQSATLPTVYLIDLTPKIAHQDQGVLEICCAIGSMVSVLEKIRNAQQAHVQELLCVPYEQYGRAVETVMKASASGETYLSTVLAALLFVTFEVIHGSIQTALEHFRHAYRVMNQYLEQRADKAGVSVRELTLTQFETSAIDMVYRLASRPWTFNFIGSDSRTTFQAPMFDVMPASFDYRIEDMPIVFDTSQEASRWWDVTYRIVARRKRSFLEATGGRIEYGGYDTDERERDAAWTDCLAAMGAWHESLHPMLQAAQRSKGKDPEQYLRTCALEIIYIKTMEALQESFQRHDGIMVPALSPMYLDIIQITAKMIEDSGGYLSPSNPLVRMLGLVAHHCEDPVILGRLISVLEKMIRYSRFSVSLWALLMAKEKSPPLKALDRAWAWYATLTALGRCEI
ncbi:hypothetical protein BX600DRAFT_513584 [Xylariales sp. PMI_506]|nr:hypothetical protein BX600DRAFT_513584 [Xylariales sp. PMI_506]